jgi:hypothetical protein
MGSVLIMAWYGGRTIPATAGIVAGDKTEQPWFNFCHLILVAELRWAW